MRKLIIITVMFAFVVSFTNNASAVAIVPVKDQKSSITISNNSTPEAVSTIQNAHKEKNPQTKENKLSKKELRKFLKAQEPNLLPETNLEWFFLLGSGVGLFIAIFGGAGIATLGWLIFAGGLITYLFYKLLKN